MAYLDVRETYADTVPGVSPRGSALFARQEWEVIVLAQRDGLSSLKAPGRLSRFLGWLFGAHPERRLANPRLETLRRLAVLVWTLGHGAPDDARRAFLDAGFSVDQLALLVSRIAPALDARKAHS